MKKCPVRDKILVENKQHLPQPKAHRDEIYDESKIIFCPYGTIDM